MLPFLKRFIQNHAQIFTDIDQQTGEPKLKFTMFNEVITHVKWSTVAQKWVDISNANESYESP
jgi:hypothetical protein